MPAVVVKRPGWVGVKCAECPGILGKPWQQWRTDPSVESVRLAERDRDRHNASKH